MLSNYFPLCSVDKPLLSMAVWLHFMMAKTAWAIDGNSSSPDDERSDFNGNMRTAAGATSFCVKISTNCSSVRLGGVLKKCKIYRRKKLLKENEKFSWNFLLCSVAEFDFCTLVQVIGIDCFLNQCTPWSWDCDLEDCMDLSPPKENSALKNCNEKNIRKPKIYLPMEAYAICNFPLLPIGMLFKCCTQRSTATGSPICTIAVPSLVFKNFIRATLPAMMTKLSWICFTDTRTI